jgi:hypothetical protein
MGGMRQLQPGLVIAVNHEPLSFLRRSGRASVDDEQHFREDHAEEAVERLARSGCSMVRMHYYKGFGVVAEQEEMALAREYVQACHRHGLMVQLYVQVGTLQYETLLAEQPAMRDWVQVDDDGRPITLVYGHQTFRWYPCFNRPGYWDYLEGIVRTAVVDFQADAIGFDNVTTAEEPFVCHCPECRTAFVAFLKERYPAATSRSPRGAEERFGHAALDHVRPPAWNYFNHPFNLSEIRDPVIQEWILFRCESLHRVLRRLSTHAKALDPDVLLEFNTYKQTGTDTAFIHGVYVPDFADSLDAFWNECDPGPAFTDDGRLLNKIRGFKMARCLGKRSFTAHPTGPARGAKVLGYAESMAFGGGIIGGVGSAADLYSGRETDFRRFGAFATSHPELFDTVPCASVGLLESKPSLAFSTLDAHLANVTIHQALLRSHVPYGLLFDPAGADAFRTLVLSAADCLGDRDLEQVVAFVERGGGVVMVGNAGGNDDWHRPRGELSLRHRLGLSKPGAAPCAFSSRGRGRVAWIPELRPGSSLDMAALAFKPFEVNQPLIGLEYWKAPRDLGLFNRALRWAAAGTTPILVRAPEHVVVDLQRIADGRGWVLHVLNYRVGTVVRGIRVSFTAPDLQPCPAGRVFEVDTGRESRAHVSTHGTLRLPPLHTYLCVELRRS